MDDPIVVTPRLSIPLDELEWRFTPSGGPGGQHANRSSTRAEVRFDVEGSPSLSAADRARLLERLGPVVIVGADDERSQRRNRERAVERLRDRLAEALRVERPRRATRPGRAARQRRLDEKRRQSAKKRDRRMGPEEH
jgi:ribosome-associated protein